MNKLKITLSLILGGLLMAASASANSVKQPNVSGQFYSGNPAQLAAEIEKYFAGAKVAPTDKQVEVMVAPHAGYMYSGPVAAYGYKAVRGKAYKTVVILAATHYYGFDGIAIWPGEGLATPLGTVPVDRDFAQKLAQKNPAYALAPQAFEREHSLEVQLPFLQKSLKDFKVVPVIMGQVSLDFCRRLAADLNALIGDRQDVLVVVSSDMSHYHNDAAAQTMDRAALGDIERMDIGKFWQDCEARKKMEMCGFVPVAVGMLLAQERGLAPEVLRYANSGDVTGEKDRVVGYASILFSRSAGAASPAVKPAVKEEGGILPLSLEQKKILLKLARETMDTYVRTAKRPPEPKVTDPRLSAPEGAFVTITSNGRLRGCIGTMVSKAPLWQTIMNMAVAASTEDPRFPPVTPEELSGLEIDISVLSQPWRIKSVDEIQLGKHGVIVGQGFNQGVFLPQVAEQTGWTKEEFLSNLCAEKAGLAPDAWKDPRTRIDIFTTNGFSESELMH